LQIKIKQVNEKSRKRKPLHAQVKQAKERQDGLKKKIKQATDYGRRMEPQEKEQPLPGEKKYQRENAEPLRGRLDDHLRAAELHSGEFGTTQSSYLLGMAILIIAHGAAIQLCLVASRRSKGRRDM
jgi:hypothetical protein